MDDLVWLDLRPAQDYARAHYACSINIQWDYLQSCLNALPSRETPLGVIAQAGLVERVKQHLCDKGYQVGKTQSCDPIAQAGLLVHSGKNNFKAWQANSLLSTQLANLTPAGKQALDLGCGGGRDAIYLAQNGWQVRAIDQQSRVLNCAKQLAQHHQVDVDWVEADVRQVAASSESQFDLIMMIRFLDRTLFKFMRNQCRPGGYVLIQTFVEGVEAFGSPKNPNYILRFGELAKEFSEFNVIVDKIELLNDGRPVASFLARRKQGETQ